MTDVLDKWEAEVREWLCDDQPVFTQLHANRLLSALSVIRKYRKATLKSTSEWRMAQLMTEAEDLLKEQS